MGGETIPDAGNCSNESCILVFEFLFERLHVPGQFVLVN